MKNKEYLYFFRFRKTIDDLFEDFPGGIFQKINLREDKPEWLSDFNPETLDDEFIGLYAERFLNRLSSQEYTIIDNEPIIYGSMSNIIDKILTTYRTKWDKLFYLYSLKMGEDYNPIENYASKEKTTYNNVTDLLIKTGTEKSAQNADVKQKPLKTSRSIIDEYGTPTGAGGAYVNGIRDSTEYHRDYSTADSVPPSDPFESTDETLIAGLNSNDYSKSEKRIHTESGGKNISAFTDETGSGESTERTGKHTSFTVDGARVVNGQETDDQLQTVSQMDENDNYSVLSFNDRKDTNVKSGNFEVEKTGNIGVMTASQMIESAWNGELTRNFILQVFRDIADLISLKCY